MLTFTFDDFDKAIIEGLVPDMIEKLELSENTSRQLATYQLALLRIAEDINEELTEKDTKDNIEKIRLVLVSFFIACLLDIDCDKRLANLCKTFFEFLKEKYEC